ncbi:YigZ family protein [uncultured Eudoraea sp.]|uniref:IMPACT family protein n=1 Tax=uncultured Eudoraea sp. TaxID=1035614 RepID=UPI002631497B|nr:YigZ family protein [uncultured Eudoraea sp.]
MENKVGLYKTVSKASEGILYKDRKSKFYAYTFPITNENDIKPIIERIRKKHPTANHVCYAWRIGVEKQRYRANDDGEPNNSAGMPIYGQIKSFGLTNVLIAVARIFGGTKLGVGGLISAYRTAAQFALESSSIIEKAVKVNYNLCFSYPLLSRVMRVIKQNAIDIVKQDMSTDCTIEISVKLSNALQTEYIFKGIHGVSISKLDD